MINSRCVKLFGLGIAAVFFQLICLQTVAVGMRVQKNVVYLQQKGRNSQDTSLDIYAPDQGENCPVIIWVHGGGWKYGDKADVALKPSAFTHTGYVLVSVNYRLHPKANFRQQASDLAAAIQWVKKNIASYAGDENQIVLMGHSAGAHLSALIATDEHYLKAKRLAFSDLKGVILLDGACYDVAGHMRDIPEKFIRKLFIDVFGKSKKLQKAASPIEFVTADQKLLPFLIIYIANRKDSKHQSGTLAQSIQQAGGSATLQAAKNDNHLTLSLTLGVAGRPATEWVFEFLEEVTELDTKSGSGKDSSTQSGSSPTK